MHIQNKNRQKKLPEVRIGYGGLLDAAFSGLSKESVGQAPEEAKEKIPLFQAEWNKHEIKVLQGMCEILDLEFYNKVIDVYVVGAHVNAMSEPLIIDARCTPDVFVDILTHELLHVLLIDNTKKVAVRKIWQEMFPEAIDRKSLYHVLVHAVHKEIYLNVLNAPERLERNLKRNFGWKSYEDAWNIVEKRGHMEIINDFKSRY